jgi:hypothetical protein
MPGPGRKRRRTETQKGTRYVFTTEDCKKGYQAALEKCSQDWHLSAWFYYRVRGYYRKRRRAR